MQVLQSTLRAPRMPCANLATQLRAAPCLAAILAAPRPIQGRHVQPSALKCSGGDASSSGSDNSGQQSGLYKGFAKQQQKATTADALQSTLAGLSANIGRSTSSNNVILDTTNDKDKWQELDLQVNAYPGQRTFKAIGTGDQDFVQAMTQCVESVVGIVHAECISQRLSAKGNYISVTVGPVWVEKPDQVLQIYENMKADGRLRFFF